MFADVEDTTDEMLRMVTWARTAFPDVMLLLSGSRSAAVQKAADLCEYGPTLSKPYDRTLIEARILRLLGRAPR